MVSSKNRKPQPMPAGPGPPPVLLNKVLLKHHPTHSFPHRLGLLLLAETLGQSLDSKRQNNLLPGPSQKTFADPWFREKQRRLTLPSLWELRGAPGEACVSEVGPRAAVGQPGRLGKGTWAALGARARDAG